MNGLRTHVRKDAGQGMTEYIIIVALIAIAAIGIVILFGRNVRALFSSSAAALSGNTQVTTQGLDTKGEVDQNVTLKNFAEGNDGKKAK